MTNDFLRRMRVWALIGFAVLVIGATLGVAIAGGDDEPALSGGKTPLSGREQGESELLARDAAFMGARIAGDIPLDNQQAGALRAAAARTAARLRKEGGAPSAGPETFTGPWTGIGPNPIVQVTRDGGPFTAMSGRIGALAIRRSGQFILGGAQGGIWLYDAATGTWTPKTDQLGSLAIGALAVAPSNDLVVYAGTGEGALSGDSYFGNGVLKSTDGGQTWNHVSGDYFEGVAMSRIVVDPTNANHLYAAVLRGRGGARRTTPTVHSEYGIWESNDGAATWTLLREAKRESNGATDLEMDPLNPKILYASFWSDAIYKSTNGGQTWSPIMTGLPVTNYAATLTRFSIAISHPSASAAAVLYAGFDWADGEGYHKSRVWKSLNAGASWSILPAGTSPDNVEDYCGGQCFYDNEIHVDPTNPNVVYAGGQFDYGIGSGGIYRSDDGGQTWKNLGYEQHPDFHAQAFDPNNPDHVLIGNDGGVWYSTSRGGRLNAGDPLSAVTWQNLNGGVDKATAAVTKRTNLQIAQFTSIATDPTSPVGLQGRKFWGGTQDNGTMRKSINSVTWFDVAGGDGGQVLVDPTDTNYVYGTFYGITPYRFTNGGASFFSNQYIRNGIDLNDRSEFYIPMTMNLDNPNQLFLGTYRLYRTDNAKAASAGDVTWKIISPDLTSGCTGPAPNGGRGCYISAIGVGGGDAVYVGTEEGWIQLSTDAEVNDSPSWDRKGIGKLPNRPVTRIAVDRSNYRIAYAAYAGFNAATPSRPGHLFRTTNGGDDWADISGNLPDSPVNTVILDPSYPNTLYVGTDVGPFVTYDGGANWSALGTGFPIVAIWQLDLDPSHGVLAAGTHGRGAWSIGNSRTVPALVLSKADAGVPIGPSKTLEYTLTLKNIGNAAATGVTITDPVPANTTFVSADGGGTESGGTVTWSVPSIPAGGSITVHLTVSVADALKNKVKTIVNDGYKATAEGGFSTTGSPTVSAIAAPYKVALAPATQTDGGRVGTTVSYPLTVSNLGFNDDSYTLSSSSSWSVTFFDASCTTAITSTGNVPSGGTANVCVKVAIPSDAANGAVNTATITATSVASPGISASATVKTIAVSVDTLLVDNDSNVPNVQSYYTTALTTAGVSFSTWDLVADKNLPLNYMKAFKNIVWFTGNSYPGPILPYEANLKAYLDNGGRLFISGQDLLDQAAGTTAFVHDYLHVTWDGSETQNDKATEKVHAVAGTLTNGLGDVALDHSILGNTFEDRITPNGTAVTIFTDDSGAADALSFAGTYKVVFLAFPLEAYGTAAQKADVVTRVMTFFGP